MISGKDEDEDDEDDEGDEDSEDDEDEGDEDDIRNEYLLTIFRKKHS